MRAHYAFGPATGYCRRFALSSRFEECGSALSFRSIAAGMGSGRDLGATGISATYPIILVLGIHGFARLLTGADLLVLGAVTAAAATPVEGHCSRSCGRWGRNYEVIGRRRCSRHFCRFFRPPRKAQEPRNLEKNLPRLRPEETNENSLSPHV